MAGGAAARLSARAIRWDGKSHKKHPTTGEDVPDETKRIAVEKFVNPNKAKWPAADYLVGNPPFIGASTMRAALGDGYVEVVRDTWPEVRESADFVMFWGHHAAPLVREGRAALRLHHHQFIAADFQSAGA